MIKKITCIECPKGCRMTVDFNKKQVLSVEGNICVKGEKYAENEMINPVRTLTTTVLAQGLSLKMIPVRTDKPIPKSKIDQAMKDIRKVKVRKPVYAGKIIKKNLLDLDVNLIVTREVNKSNF